jgi:glycosyltransferase involved in cell wall biosynthesis
VDSTQFLDRLDNVSTVKPTFSIITAVFNGDKFIQETILSVLANAPSGDFEYIVIDDGSTDGTSEILERFRSEIKLLRQENSGEANSVNLGLGMATGKYALVVSADDPLISPELFTQSKMILDADPKIMATYPDWYLIDEAGVVKKKVCTLEFSIQALVGFNKCIPGPGAIFRIQEAKLLGGRNPKYKFGSDFEFWLRLADLGRFQRIPMHIAQWRSHEDSTSIKNRGLEMSKERIQIMEEYLASSVHSDRINRMAMGNAFYSAAILRYFSPDVPHRKYLAKAFQSRKGWPENAKFRELLYLYTLPLSEFVWIRFRSYFNRKK